MHDAVIVGARCGGASTAMVTGAIPLPDSLSSENVGRILTAAKNVEFHT